ncbi:glycosyltransferase family 9 protein [Cellulomonas sp. URHE0023]|uniref:glycosyltransferase family 9 protein n=1 Tax=Cellulomonas sp. URHE0023 TaxID=1380354 RepID=UPI000481C3A3|nr:glycosyltransferase family 9 protein [Cellulomonas sp. URHE0023]
MSGVLAVRLDSDGDVLLTGPAIRALGRLGDVDLLVSPAGLQAAELLPGVRSVRTFDAPWSGLSPAPVDPALVHELVDRLRAAAYDRAVVFTSFHQSPLPTALVLRLAGVPFVAATSEDYPGSLLDVRHARPDGLHEVDAALRLAEAAGGALRMDDDGHLAVRGPLPDVRDLVPSGPYVVVHPSASVPARAPSPAQAIEIVGSLVDAGRVVVVTGGPKDTRLSADVAHGSPAAVDLGGRTSLAELASVLAGADAVVVGNTGPAHLAAAVGTPVVSLFSPVVPAERWAPFGVPHVVLGDQSAACADSRARLCPLVGHPCLTSVSTDEVVSAVDLLAGHVRHEVVA